MNLPNIQSKHPVIYSDLAHSERLLKDAEELVKKAHYLRQHAVECLKKAENWTGVQLARNCGFTVQYLHGIKHGKYCWKDEYLEKIDGVLNTQLADEPA